MNLKNLLLVLSFTTSQSIFAQTLRVVQIPSSLAVVPLSNKVVEYRISPDGDAVNPPSLRFGLYPLSPLTTDDVGEVVITEGGSTQTRGLLIRRDATALDLTVRLSSPIANRGSTALSLTMIPKIGRREGLVVIKLEEVASIGLATRQPMLLAGGEAYSLAVQLPDTRLHLTETLEQDSSATTFLNLRWFSENNKHYRLEGTADFRNWRSVISDIPGTGAEVRARIALSRSSQDREFYRVAEIIPPPVAPPPVQQPPPVIPPPPPPPAVQPPPPPASSGPVGFGYSSEPLPGQSGFGYP